MDTTGYKSNYGIKGAVPIEMIIPHSLKSDAEEWCQYMRDLTLSGKKTDTNRTDEEIEKDQAAIELLKKFQAEDNPDREAMAYGFMLYDEGDIVKIYWAKYCGKLRQDKREFYGQDKYLEWITEIFSTLNGDHEKFHDPLYYYKLDDVNKRGAHVGHYDIMNSFRVYWNQYFLSILAQYLYAEDSKEREQKSVSIDAVKENENGAGNYLDAELSHKVNYTLDVEQQTTYGEIEDFLASFLEPPLNQPIPSKAGTKSEGVTYLDVMKLIVQGTLTSAANFRKEIKLSQSVQTRAMDHLYTLMERRGISLQDLADYLADYGTIAEDILEGIDNSFRYEYED